MSAITAETVSVRGLQNTDGFLEKHNPSLVQVWPFETHLSFYWTEIRHNSLLPNRVSGILLTLHALDLYIFPFV